VYIVGLLEFAENNFEFNLFGIYCEGKPN